MESASPAASACPHRLTVRACADKHASPSEARRSYLGLEVEIRPREELRHNRTAWRRECTHCCLDLSANESGRRAASNRTLGLDLHNVRIASWRNTFVSFTRLLHVGGTQDRCKPGGPGDSRRSRVVSSAGSNGSRTRAATERLGCCAAVEAEHTTFAGFAVLANAAPPGITTAKAAVVAMAAQTTSRDEYLWFMSPLNNDGRHFRQWSVMITLGTEDNELVAVIDDSFQLLDYGWCCHS